LINESIMARRTIGGSNRERARIGVGIVNDPSIQNATWHRTTVVCRVD
jgi:hypothetical protein